MTDKVNDWRYAYVSPRGFANEYQIWRVRVSDASGVAELQDLIAAFEADHNESGGDAYWFEPSARQARRAVDWADRQYV